MDRAPRANRTENDWIQTKTSLLSWLHGRFYRKMQLRNLRRNQSTSRFCISEVTSKLVDCSRPIRIENDDRLQYQQEFIGEFYSHKSLKKTNYFQSALLNHTNYKYTRLWSHTLLPIVERGPPIMLSKVSFYI